MDKETKKRLEMVLNFSKTNLSLLSFEQVHALKKEFGRWIGPLIKRNQQDGIYSSEVDLVLLQKMLVPIWDSVTKGIEKKEFFYQPPDLRPILYEDSGKRFVITLQPDPHRVIEAQQAGTPNEAFSSLLNSFIVGRFLEMLNGVPIASVVECLECGRIFLHFTKKNKEFCTLRCYKRNYHRERLLRIKRSAKDYKKHLEKQRKYGADAYLKKKQAKYGPNATVKRRGRRVK